MMKKGSVVAGRLESPFPESGRKVFGRFSTSRGIGGPPLQRIMRQDGQVSAHLIRVQRRNQALDFDVASVLASSRGGEE
jgi:hypothetical protein